MIIYCAGPMFSPAEKWEQSKIAKRLRKDGFQCFVPHEDGLEVNEVMSLLLSGNKEIIERVMFFREPMRRAIFALDTYQVVDRCHCTVFNMNGRVPDGGSIAEATMAHMSGKPVVLYKSTPISLIGGEDNPLIDGLAEDWKNVDCKKKLAAEILGAQRVRAFKNSAWKHEPPHHFQPDLQMGESIWAVLAATKAEGNDDGALPFFEWTAQIEDLLMRLPSLIKTHGVLEVTDERRVQIRGQKDTLELGRLTTGDDATALLAHGNAIWKGFGDVLRPFIPDEWV